jgi:hypothetical protein
VKNYEAPVVWENSVWYWRPRFWERAPRASIYLYKWRSPSGHVGIDHVYCVRYQDFQALLKHWSRNEWSYSEL